MTTSNEQVDFEVVHKAIVSKIKAAMPVLKTVNSYDPTDRDVIVTPALLIELVEIKPGKKIGDGRLPITAEFAAHCCLSVKTDNVDIEIRNFAAKTLQVVNGNRWGLPKAVERPAALGAFPGMFKPDDKGFESWVVVWEQDVHLGEIWQDADFLPQDAYLSAAPNVGLANQDKYEKITDG